MRTIVDTSSLVRMAQSYQPFDSTETLESFLKNEMENGSLILLDKVVGEIRNVDKGIAYETFKCLRDKKYVCSTTGLVPSPRFYNMLDNNFVDRAYKKIKLQGMRTHTRMNARRMSGVLIAPSSCMRCKRKTPLSLSRFLPRKVFIRTMENFFVRYLLYARRWIFRLSMLCSISSSMKMN